MALVAAGSFLSPVGSEESPEFGTEKPTLEFDTTPESSAGERETEPESELESEVGVDAPLQGDSSSAIALLDELEVKGRAPKTGYSRTEQFGKAWIDVDRNGCDTRNDILQRDLVDVALKGACKVLSGTLNDPFTGKAIAFVRGNDTSALVQIDHVVAMHDAWQKGAQQLTQEQRIAFANDPLNLLAVDGGANSRKSDSDAASWLPPNKGFRCEYVARQVFVKAKYELWVTQPEKDAMHKVLESCPAQPAR